MYVNTNDVMTLASTIESINNNIANAASDITSAMNRLNGSWDGASASAVMSLFNNIRDNCIEAQRSCVAEYARFLRERVALGYEEVEKQNISLSELFK